MNHGRTTSAIGRRAFLGYCGATTALIATTAIAWAAQTATADAEVTARALQRLADTLEGDLLLPDDALFEPARSVSWNRMLPERRPDLIVMARSQADVVATLGFARDQGRKVAVRGGGHSWCASSLRQGGVLLDLSYMRSLEIDAGRGIATVGPAVRGAELIQRAAEHGLAFPVAHCPTVPMSGFLLNGGNGLNFNRWGTACSNVVAIDLVLADGRELLVSSEQHADLFWAARGAGPGFFAVATRYHLQLHALPGAVVTSAYVFPESAVGTASELVDSLAAEISRDVVLSLSIGAPPQGLATDDAAVATVVAAAYSDSVAAAEVALRPLNSDPRVGLAASSSVNVPTDLNTVLTAAGTALPGGHRCLVDNVWRMYRWERCLRGARLTTPGPRRRHPTSWRSVSIQARDRMTRRTLGRGAFSSTTTRSGRIPPKIMRTAPGMRVPPRCWIRTRSAAMWEKPTSPRRPMSPSSAIRQTRGRGCARCAPPTIRQACSMTTWGWSSCASVRVNQ